MPTSLFELLRAADDALREYVRYGSVAVHLAVFVPLGAIVGRFLHRWIFDFPDPPRFFTVPVCPHCGTKFSAAERVPILGALLQRGRCRVCHQPAGTGRWVVEASTAALFAALILAVSHLGSQTITEGGSIDYFHWRVLTQCLLISLLIVATGIDFRYYLIPDSVTLTGMIAGIATATIVGNLQLIPLWIDWNDPYAAVLGPYIPEWIKQHSHWHGLAWSVAGLLAGGLITWSARAISRAVLGVEALGFGDVTLMAMIGSFLGWQAIVLTFALAPLCGVLAGIALLLSGGRRVLPYGPCLSAAAILVLFTFRWLWIPTRTHFGHWPTLVFLAAVSAGGLAALLGLLRLYRMIPTRPR